MNCIVSPTTDPVFNLAAEEYFFRQFTGDILFLYRNDPSVVVGKHQNAMAEINPNYAYNNNIEIIRRMSGGGAVYHDLGNLNFSFHKTVDDTAKVRYSDFCVPVVETLHSFGVPAEINSRNDIVVEGMKVSGHAQHVFRNRILSHGTLLINSDLEQLSMVLKRGPGSYESRAIQSVRSKVANVSGFLFGEIAIDKFIKCLIERIVETNPGSKIIEISANDKREIEILAAEKYSTWEWNFGYSPMYSFKNEIETDEGKKLSCLLSVEKGKIIDVKIGGNLIPSEESDYLEKDLRGLPHNTKTILGLLSTYMEINDFEKNALFRLLF
jgi:lipoate-protein ligase A